MVDALNQVGMSVCWDGPDLVVQGIIKPSEQNIFVANSGTTIRFLSAMLAAIGGDYKFDGIERMRMRPIKDLADALTQLGVNATCSDSGCPPLEILSRGFTQSRCVVRGDISSQYLSGLLMAAPACERQVEIGVKGKLVSVPYVDITLSVMSAFGVNVSKGDYQSFLVSPSDSYSSCEYAIEPDASAASYFFAAAAVTGGTVTVSGLTRDAMQGDVAFCDCLAKMGCEVEYGSDSITVTGGPLNGIDIDMNAISDTVPTLGVVALFAHGTTNIRNVAHVRHKETDRISDLGTELKKFGAEITERPDGLSINAGDLHGATIDTYNDHRMAMSFAIAGLKIENVIINNPGCCEKTYPEFFTDLERILRP